MKNLYQTKPLTKAQITLNRRWIEALRSGGYQQGRFRLFDGAKYCCLGVACTVAGLKAQAKNDGSLGFGIERNAHTLPGSVMDRLGLESEIGEYSLTHDHVDNSLTSDNDAGGTFNTIANIIEGQLERKIAKDKGK